MYQVIIQYFEERFASFFVHEPIQEYKDLLNHVKNAIPVLKDLKDEDIKILYKDIQLDTFINIDSSEYSGNLHLSEAFRNATSTGSDIHRRVHLQVRETDLPFILKKRASRLVTDNIATPQSSQPTSTQLDTGKIAKSLLPTFIKNPEKSEEKSQFLQTDNWKSSKRAQIGTKLQALSDQKLAIETPIRELELDVVEPPRVGVLGRITPFAENVIFEATEVRETDEMALVTLLHALRTIIVARKISTRNILMKLRKEKKN